MRIKAQNPFKRSRGLDFNRRRGRRRVGNLRPGAFFFGQIAGVCALGFLIAFLFFSGITVSGVSMSPTLADGQRVLINRVMPVFSLRVGDVVAFKTGSGHRSTVSIKRVVAVPGDTVRIEGGNLYINGKREKPAFETESILDAGKARNEFTLPAGEYFLLGDNRNNSEDSRFESVGNIKKSDIIGLVWLCYSTDNFGLVG